jgi:hypothetical protein
MLGKTDDFRFSILVFVAEFEITIFELILKSLGFWISVGGFVFSPYSLYVLNLAKPYGNFNF